MANLSNYFYIALTIVFTVYGQLILKWRIAVYGNFPENKMEKFQFLFRLFLDPLILSGFGAALLASIMWMIALTKFDLNYAYPFMSFNFVIVLLLGNWLFGEPINTYKIIGVSLIVMGTFICAKG